MGDTPDEVKRLIIWVKSTRVGGDFYTVRKI